MLILDELGLVPLSKSGAELLFELLSQRYEQASTLVTSNLPFAEWTAILGSERLTGARLDFLCALFGSSSPNVRMNPSQVAKVRCLPNHPIRKAIAVELRRIDVVDAELKRSPEQRLCLAGSASYLRNWIAP